MGLRYVLTFSAAFLPARGLMQSQNVSFLAFFHGFTILSHSVQAAITETGSHEKTPVGYTTEEIKDMGDEELLDTEYFLYEQTIWRIHVYLLILHMVFCWYKSPVFHACFDRDPVKAYIDFARQPQNSAIRGSYRRNAVCIQLGRTAQNRLFDTSVLHVRTESSPCTGRPQYPQSLSLHRRPAGFTKITEYTGSVHKRAEHPELSHGTFREIKDFGTSLQPSRSDGGALRIFPGFSRSGKCDSRERSESERRRSVADQPPLPRPHIPARTFPRRLPPERHRETPRFSIIHNKGFENSLI